MTASLPRLAHALLNRLALDNEPLAGDLAEEFHRRRSRLWLWQQLAYAFVRQALYAPHPPVALKLEHFDPVVAEWMMQKRLEKKRRVNLTGTGVEGIGGLTMVILGFMVSMVVPAIWWFVVGSMIAGLLCGAALVKFQRQVIKPLRPLKLLN
jgi:hypothetical protein